MELASAGVEYAYFTIFSEQPITSTPYVAFTRNGYETDSATVWNVAVWTTPADRSRTLRVLVGAHAANPMPNGAIVLAKGRWQSWVKFDENPETVIRPGAELICVR